MTFLALMFLLAASALPASLIILHYALRAYRRPLEEEGVKPDWLYHRGA